MSKGLTPPLDQSVDALVATRCLHHDDDDDDDKHISQKAKDKLKAAAEEGNILDHAYERMRFGNAQGFSVAGRFR